MIFELGFVNRLVIGGVHVMGFGFKACIHDGKVLVRQGHINHEIRLYIINQGDRIGDNISIKGGNRNINIEVLFDVFLNGFTLRNCTASEMGILKNIRVHRTFFRNHVARTTCADNKNSHAHLLSRPNRRLALARYNFHATE